MKRKYIFAISLLVLSTSFAFSKSIAIHKQDNVSSDGYRISYGKCLDKSGGVTLFMLNCIAEERDYQEQRMNKNYNKLMQLLNVKQKRDLVKAQQSWLVYAKAINDLDFSIAVGTGGTSANLIFTEVYLEKIVRQANYLGDKISYIKTGSPI